MPLDPRWQQDLTNPIRRLGFYIALMLIFVRFSMIHELLSFYFRVPVYLLAALGIPCVFLAIISGGLRRTLRFRMSYYWLGFMGWLVLAIPLSYWVGGSLFWVSSYFRTQFVMLFVVAGLVMGWKECRQVMYAIALGALVNVITAQVFQSQDGARLSLVFAGSISNSNDFAAHLMLCLPFVLFFFVTAGPNFLLRIITLIVAGVAYHVIMSTGSRGALVAIIVASTYALVRAPAHLRIAGIIVMPLLVLLSVGLLPKETLSRYGTLFGTAAGEEDLAAKASSQTRTYLLRTSTLFSLQHPLLGVGPGEFEDHEAEIAKSANRRAVWMPTHNSYTQISSEAGIPALLFMIAALVSTYRILNNIYKQARTRAVLRPIMMASFCTMLAMVSFCSVIFFLSLAYKFYLPALSGLAIALNGAAQAEFAKVKPAGS